MGTRRPRGAGPPGYIGRQRPLTMPPPGRYGGFRPTNTGSPPNCDPDIDTDRSGWPKPPPDRPNSALL